MPYGIHRIEKRKASAVFGLQVEAMRKPADKDKRNFEASSINWDLTKNNVIIQGSSFNWKKTIDEVTKQHGVKVKKDSVVMLDAIYTASPEFFKNKTKSEMMDYFKDCLDFHRKHYGKVISAVIHFDETTPHMHVVSVPIIKTGERWALSAKLIMGRPADYRRRQDEFYEQVTKRFGLDRGARSDPAKKRKYLCVQDFKKYMNEIIIEKQKKQIETQYSEIGAKKVLLQQTSDKLEAIEKKVQETEEILNMNAEHIKIQKSDWKKLQEFMKEALKRQENEIEFSIMKEFLSQLGDFGIIDKKGLKFKLSDAYEQFKEICLAELEKTYSKNPIQGWANEPELDEEELER